MTLIPSFVRVQHRPTLLLLISQKKIQRSLQIQKNPSPLLLPQATKAEKGNKNKEGEEEESTSDQILREKRRRINALGRRGSDTNPGSPLSCHVSIAVELRGGCSFSNVSFGIFSSPFSGKEQHVGVDGWRGTSIRSPLSRQRQKFFLRGKYQ